jgi:hypothetical protein
MFSPVNSSRHGFNYALALAALATIAGIGLNLRSNFFLNASFSGGVMSLKIFRFCGVVGMRRTEFKAR